jgi:hypothetical protein
MNSRTWGFAVSPTLALTLWLTSGLASAQPALGDPPPAGPPAATAEPAAMPPPPPPMNAPAEEADTSRPTDLAIAIGVGYRFPTSLQTPNITSVRVRLPSGLTFEPQLVLATTSNDVDTGMTVTNKQSEITLGSLVRYPLRVHRKVDLELLGSAAISNSTVDPNGDDNNRTITTITLGYGVGLSYWLSRHWNLSLTASNPLISYVRTRQEQGPAAVTVDKTTTLGLVFEPTVALMIHLYE